MSVLLDTNILTRSAQPGHPMHKAAVDAVDILRTRGEQLYVVPQNMVEFWAVATRPISVNGLGMTPTQAQAELVLIKSLFGCCQTLLQSMTSGRRLFPGIRCLDGTRTMRE